jgi:hypothetical protein
MLLHHMFTNRAFAAFFSSAFLVLCELEQNTTLLVLAFGELLA